MRLVTGKSEKQEKIAFREALKDVHDRAMGKNATIVAHGSVLTNPNYANDIDIVHGGLDRENGPHGMGLLPSFDGRIVPTLTEDSEITMSNIVSHWAWSRGIPYLPIDNQSTEKSGKVYVPTPWGVHAPYEVIQEGDYDVELFTVNGLASALRGDKISPGSFQDWRHQAHKVRVQRGPFHSYPGIWVDDDATEGIAAIQKAMVNHPEGEKLVLSLRLGREILALINNGPVFVETDPWQNVKHFPESSTVIVFDMDNGEIRYGC